MKTKAIFNGRAFSFNNQSADINFMRQPVRNKSANANAQYIIRDSKYENNGTDKYKFNIRNSLSYLIGLNNKDVLTKSIIGMKNRRYTLHNNRDCILQKFRKNMFTKAKANQTCVSTYLNSKDIRKPQSQEMTPLGMVTNENTFIECYHNTTKLNDKKQTVLINIEVKNNQESPEKRKPIVIIKHKKLNSIYATRSEKSPSKGAFLCVNCVKIKESPKKEETFNFVKHTKSFEKPNHSTLLQVPLIPSPEANTNVREIIKRKLIVKLNSCIDETDTDLTEVPFHKFALEDKNDVSLPCIENKSKRKVIYLRVKNN